MSTDQELPSYYFMERFEIPFLMINSDKKVSWYHRLYLIITWGAWGLSGTIFCVFTLLQILISNRSFSDSLYSSFCCGLIFPLIIIAHWFLYRAILFVAFGSSAFK